VWHSRQVCSRWQLTHERMLRCALSIGPSGIPSPNSP
jgi:hypothetical protein